MFWLFHIYFQILNYKNMQVPNNKLLQIPFLLSFNQYKQQAFHQGGFIRHFLIFFMKNQLVLIVYFSQQIGKYHKFKSCFGGLQKYSIRLNNLNFASDGQQKIINQMETIIKKKLQIPRKGAVSDKETLEEKQISDELFRMKEGIYGSSSADSSMFQLSPTTSRVEIKKKKGRRNLVETKFDSNFINQHKLGLRKVVQQQKVKSIVKNFITKISRNMVGSTPIQYQPYVKSSDNSFFSRSGFQIPNWFDLTFAFFSIIQILALCFVYTLALVFDKFIDGEVISTLQTFSMCFYTIEIIINFISIKTIEGRKITAFRQIFSNYFKRKFFIDLLCLIILVLDINTQFVVTKYIRLSVVLKIKECLQKMQKIENVFVNNFYQEQYWQLIKVFFVNFGFAHFLAVFLLAMATLSETDNWIIKINIVHDPWHEQYAWAYYWGSTIMLTVGFGDLSASNYKQAICLTLIETFSCILLAYNINCVGNLINNIRNQDVEKVKNFKLIRKLAKENNINDELEWKVCNFIDQSDKMKKKFEFEDQKKFISNLPHELKAEFLKQSNIKIFQSIGFFKNFSERTLLNLAERIEVKIAHPQQIIFKYQDDPQLLILKSGRVGYCTKLIGSDYCGTVIDVLKVKKKQQPKLIYLGFLTNKNTGPKFVIKSLKYSMIYFIGMEQVIQTLKDSRCDFEGYCQMKDKSKHIMDQFQIIECKNCKTKHSKMNCPKLHYCPLHQIVIYKHIQSVKNSRNQRKSFPRHRTRSQLASNCPFKLQNYFVKLEEQIFKRKRSKNNRLMNSSSAKKQQQELQAAEKINYQESFFSKMNTNISSLIEEHLLESIEKKFVQNVKQIINQKKISQQQLFYWDVECDAAHNFKFYFQNSNPKQLTSIIPQKQASVQERTAAQEQKIPNLLFDFISNLDYK